MRTEGVRTTEEFIQEAKLVHGDKYDYSITIYHGCKKKLQYICPIHGVISQIAYDHLKGHGCMYCNHAFQDTNSFIQKAKSIYGNQYDYSLVDYKNQYTPVKIKCNTCGQISELIPKYFLMQESGCKFCHSSKGENAIKRFLDSKHISYKRNFKFEGYLNSYDFYLPEENLLIEFNGRQHYMPVSIFGGEKSFKKQQESDALKLALAQKNGIKLLIISYKDYKLIPQILEENLNG